MELESCKYVSGTSPNISCGAIANFELLIPSPALVEQLSILFWVIFIVSVRFHTHVITATT